MDESTKLLILICFIVILLTLRVNITTDKIEIQFGLYQLLKDLLQK